MGNSNSTSCPVEHMPEDPEPFISDGNFNFKTHDVGWIIAGFFGLIASVTSFWLIKKHLEFYTKPTQQKYIVRVLFMVPCYAIYSWLSYYWWKEAIYFQLMRDCYEAVVIASFFSLLLYYLGDNEEEHATVFKHVKFKKWIWPLGSLKYKPSGPRFLSIMQWSIGQYWIFRPGCTFAAVFTQFFNLYCLESWSPRFSHVWTTTLISISVTLAMYAILQFYVTMKVELAPFQPLLKFFAVKAVVFLTFWVDSFLAVLVALEVIKPSKYWTAAEIQVGIGALISCFEMMVFGFLHVKCFTYRIYRDREYDHQEEESGGGEEAGQSTPKHSKSTRTQTSKWRAFIDVIDLRDVFRDLWKGTKQVTRLCIGKKVEKSFTQDADHLEGALGRSRLLPRGSKNNREAEERSATLALMKEKTDVEKELERVKLKLKTLDSPNYDRNHAFIDNLNSGIEGLPSSQGTPWANTTTAFTPLLNLTDGGVSAPSSTGAIAGTTGSTRSSRLAGRREHAAGTYALVTDVGSSIGDVRGIPKSSTGILYPHPPPESHMRRDMDEGYKINVDRPVYYPEKIEGDGDEIVYDKPTSWFKRVFRRSGNVTTSATHMPIRASMDARDDPGIQEILQDRSLSYDYPSATLDQIVTPQQRKSAESASYPQHPLTRPPPEKGRLIERVPVPRLGVKMPNPLSPSRYPGFDEQAYVDNMYARHEQDRASPPKQLNLVARHTESGPPGTASIVSPSGELYPIVATPGRRPTAALVQPPQATNAPSNMAGIGTPTMRLPRHSLSDMHRHAVVSPDATRSRRPLPPPPPKESPPPPSSPLQLASPSRHGGHAGSLQHQEGLESQRTAAKRQGPVQRLGLGLSMVNEDEAGEPSANLRDQRRFLYDDY